MSENDGKKCNLASTHLRLHPDVSVEKLPVDETFWPRLMSGELGDFHNEYLVTAFTFEEDWPTWEIHPKGDEIVVLLSGKATLVLESDTGTDTEVTLEKAGDFAFVPKGTWHTARINTPAHMLFITAGEGTENRPI